MSYESGRDTLPGWHDDAAPREEGKLVRRTHGAVDDVAFELRPDSPPDLVLLAVRPAEENRPAMWTPRVAHGYAGDPDHQR